MNDKDPNNLINILNLIKSPNEKQRNNGIQLMHYFEMEEENFEVCFQLFYNPNIEKKYKKMILTVINNLYIILIKENISNLEIEENNIYKNVIKVKLENIVWFYYDNLKNGDDSLVEILIYNWEKIMTIKNKFYQEILQETFLNLKNKIISDINFWKESHKNIKIFLNILLFIIKYNNLQFINRNTLFNEISSFYLEFISQYFDKFIDNDKIINDNSLILIIEILETLVVYYKDKNRTELYNLLFNNDTILDFLTKLSFKLFNKLNNETHLKILILKLFKKIYKLIENKISKNKSEFRSRNKKDNNINQNIKKFVSLIKSLFELLFNELILIINSNSFNIKYERENKNGSKYYYYFYVSIGFLNYFNKKNIHFEFFLKNYKKLFLDVLMNLIALDNDNSELDYNNYSEYIDKNLKLIDDKKKECKDKIIFKTLNFIQSIINNIDGGLKLMYDTIKYGIIDSTKLYNELECDKNELSIFYTNTKNCKWNMQFKDYEQLDNYIIILIYIFNELNNEQNEYDFIKLFIDKTNNDIITNKNRILIPLKMKFNYLLILFTKKISDNIYNFQTNGLPYLKILLNQLYNNDLCIINAYVIRLIYNFMISNEKLKLYFIEHFFTFSLDIVNFIIKVNNEVYYSILNCIFINHYDLCIKSNKNYQNIYLLIFNYILNNIYQIILNKECDSKYQKYFNSLNHLLSNTNFVELFSKVIYDNLICLIGKTKWKDENIFNDCLIQLIIIFVKNSKNKVLIIELLYKTTEILTRYKYHFNLLFVIIEFMKDNNIASNVNNYNGIMLFIKKYYFVDYVLKNELKIIFSTYFFINFIETFKNIIDNDFYLELYSNIFNYFNRLIKWNVKKHVNFKSDFLYIFKNKTKLVLHLVSLIVFWNNYFNLSLLNEDNRSFISDVYQVLASNFKIIYLSKNLNKILIISIISNLNKNFLNKKLKKKIIMFLVDILTLVYLRSELNELNKYMIEYKDNNRNNLIDIKNNINNTIEDLNLKKYIEFTSHLNIEIDIDLENNTVEIIKIEEDLNYTIEPILQNINEFLFFQNYLKNEENTLNMLKKEDFIISMLMNIEVYNCNDCNQYKTRMIYK